MIASATQDAIDDDIIRRVPDQINFAIIGVIVAIVMATIDYRLLGSLSPWLYAGIVTLLAVVVAFGVEGAGGAKRWLNIGIRIQPSEIGKIILIITLSQYIAERYLDLGKISTVFRTIIHVAIPAALILFQPDLGTTLVFLFIWAVIVWSAGLRLRHIALFLLRADGSSAHHIPANETGYQRARIETFINPDLDPDGAYNINQARISIGSGGLLGKGYAVGPQNTGRFLRVRHTDFIFSVIAHEFGMVGGIAVLGDVRPGIVAHFEGRARSQRSPRQHDLLRRGRHDILPDDRVYRHESQSDARHRFDPALRELRRHVAAVYHGGHWPRRERDRAAPPNHHLTSFDAA